MMTGLSPGGSSRTFLKLLISDNFFQDPQRTALGLFGHDGVFADYVCVPIENLNKVPDNVPNEDAVFAEPLASACQIMQQVR